MNPNESAPKTQAQLVAEETAKYAAHNILRATEARQAEYVEALAVQPGERAYPHAQATVNRIKAEKGFREPEKVQVTANADCLVEGAQVKAGQQLGVWPWQARALARFFAKLAAIVLLLCGLSASAETAISGSTLGGYQLYSIAGLVGTNGLGWQVTSNYYAPVLVTNLTVGVTVTNINGIPTFGSLTNTNIVTTYPAAVNLTRWDKCSLQWSFSLMGGTSTTNLTSYWSSSCDGTNWSTNWLTWVVAPNGTTPVTAVTNLYNLAGIGYIRLDAIYDGSKTNSTNHLMLVAKTPVLTGP